MQKPTLLNSFPFVFVDRLISSHPNYHNSALNHSSLVKNQPSYYCEYISNGGIALQGFNDMFNIKFLQDIPKYSDELLLTHHYIKTEVCENTDGHYEEHHHEDLVKVEEPDPLSDSPLTNPQHKQHPFINDTKNIPKNFGKAIITFIQKNQTLIKKYLLRYNIQLTDLLKQLKCRKKSLHSIRELRALWIEEEFPFAHAFRQISYHFLRKGVFRYIFGSRIADYGSHLKYRFRIMEAIENPKSFNSIKI